MARILAYISIMVIASSIMVWHYIYGYGAGYRDAVNELSQASDTDVYTVWLRNEGSAHHYSWYERGWSTAASQISAERWRNRKTEYLQRYSIDSSDTMILMLINHNVIGMELKYHMSDTTSMPSYAILSGELSTYGDRLTSSMNAEKNELYTRIYRYSRTEHGHGDFLFDDSPYCELTKLLDTPREKIPSASECSLDKGTAG